MIDHIGIPVSDYPRSKQFYQQVLATLGAQLLMEPTPEQTVDGHYAAGFGRGHKPTFWIAPGDVGTHLHVAFTTDTRASVDAFYQAALAAGARDNGAPGLRPHYHPNYYGAFVLDPDGHNIEAVCHREAD
ncbi:VOC family protein [Lysobacter koreensis]|uniref:VOC family protein n=1 Tax=Lysobacter koreensis TaxID=266122 RepID=A0ABW2YK05_9GAMM